MVALAAADERRAEVKVPGAAGRGCGQDLVQQQAKLSAGKRGDGPVGLGMVLHAEARIKQTEILGHLGDRRHGRLARAARDPLFDGDGGRDASQTVDRRPGELLDELPRVGGHRFHEAALALGKHDVKRQRGLARTRDPGDDREPVVGNPDTEVLQIVFACTEDGEFRVRGSGFWVQDSGIRVVGRGSLSCPQRGTLKAEFRAARSGVRPKQFVIYQMTRSERGVEKRRCGGAGTSDGFRRAFGHDATALGTGPRADLEDPVGRLEDVEVVLDDNYTVAAMNKPLQYVEQAPHVVLVQPRGGFIEEEQRGAQAL